MLDEEARMVVLIEAVKKEDMIETEVVHLAQQAAV